MPEADPAQTRQAVLSLIRQAWAKRMFPIYLHGPTGTGKSYAAAVVAEAVWLKGVKQFGESHPKPIWWTWPKICESVAKCRHTGTVMVKKWDGKSYEFTEQDVWNDLSQPRLLVVDEIGSRDANDVRLEVMCQLLDLRENKPTIFTGNLDAAKLKAMYDNKVVSRLSKGQWIKFEGVDRRAVGFGSRAASVES